MAGQRNVNTLSLMYYNLYKGILQLMFQAVVYNAVQVKLKILSYEVSNCKYNWSQTDHLSNGFVTNF